MALTVLLSEAIRVEYPPVPTTTTTHSDTREAYSIQGYTRPAVSKGVRWLRSRNEHTQFWEEMHEVGYKSDVFQERQPVNEGLGI